MIRFLIEKEFKQMFRNRALPGMIFGMPLMMMLLLPWAANQEVNNIKLSVIDRDNSIYSQRLLNKVVASGYFHLFNEAENNEAALKNIANKESDLVLEIENHFGRNLIKEGRAGVMISANAVNINKGGLGSSYLMNIINDFSLIIRNEQLGGSSGSALAPKIQIYTLNKFNTYLNYQVLMVPALMVMLLTMLCGFMPSLNIVGEKEVGTIEQMNVTPVSKFGFIIAKLIPYWVMGIVVMSICFGLAVVIYNLYPAGNLLTVYLFAAIYILGISGLGLIVSNYSSTMQQAMFVMFFFVMILNLMSGLFTPIASMPNWAQNITIFNPLKYFVEVMRSVYLKGSSILDLRKQLIALLSFATVFNLWAVFSYKKSS